MRVLLFSLAILLLQACNYKSETVDMVVHNAVIYTVDGQFTVAEAMAIDSGKIVAVGPEQEIRNRYQSRSLVNAEGRAVYPGFIDSHCHFVGYGLDADEANLKGATSWSECVDRLEAYAVDHSDGWLIGRGWDQYEWENQDLPTRAELDKQFPNRPVMLTRVDGHAVIVNQKALDLAGLTKAKRINGGEIMVDEQGKLTGLLIDNAMTLVDEVVGQPSMSSIEQGVLRAQENCFAVGLTTVDDAGLDTSVVNLIDKMQQSGALKMRIYAMLEATDAGLEYMKRGKRITDRLTVRSIKLYGDGSLGSRGAALKKDYHDREGHRGAFIHMPSFYQKWASLCDLYGYQMNTHCIGDKANALVLSVYKNQLGGSNDKRWRIEHAQVLSDDDMAIFGGYNILPSIQPTHATSDMRWAEERLGAERMQGAYAYKDLLAENGIVLLGTDFPVEGIDPLATFYAAVFRKDKEGLPTEGWRKEQALDRREALQGITIWGALGNHEEEVKGSLEVGKWADFVILDRDILEVAETEVLKTKVLETYLAGERVFQR